MPSVRFDLGWSQKKMRADNRIFFHWQSLCRFSRDAKRILVVRSRSHGGNPARKTCAHCVDASVARDRSAESKSVICRKRRLELIKLVHKAVKQFQPFVILRFG